MFCSVLLFIYIFNALFVMGLFFLKIDSSTTSMQSSQPAISSFVPASVLNVDHFLSFYKWRNLSEKQIDDIEKFSVSFVWLLKCICRSMIKQLGYVICLPTYNYLNNIKK